MFSFLPRLIEIQTGSRERIRKTAAPVQSTRGDKRERGEDEEESAVRYETNHDDEDVGGREARAGCGQARRPVRPGREEAIRNEDGFRSGRGLSTG